jgi:hypothetical protein
MTEKMTTDEAWREVGRHLETLGESLAETFRSAWKRAEDQQQLQGMQSGLEAMVSKVSRAIEEAGALPEAQQARQEAGAPGYGEDGRVPECSGRENVAGGATSRGLCPGSGQHGASKAHRPAGISVRGYS